MNPFQFWDEDYILKGNLWLWKGRRHNVNDQAIVWFNGYKLFLFLADKLLIHSCGPPKPRILNFQFF